MKIYGCKVRSLIDGGAPGYFIIGPFVNKDDADKITYIYNKLLDEKGQEYANYLSYILNTYGYHESDHGHATLSLIHI